MLEACLELLASGAVAGIQDMGAAGLTCSTCETASRAGRESRLILSTYTQREPGMTPYEIMLSESQERMLIIVDEVGKEQTVRDIFEKWDLPYAQVGVVKDDGMMRVTVRGENGGGDTGGQAGGGCGLYITGRRRRPLKAKPCGAYKRGLIRRILMPWACC